MFIVQKENMRFEWSSGAYIDVFAKVSNFAFDAINVYDYELGKPRIDSAGFFSEVDNYLVEEG